jgi:hypothetical protein
MARKNRKDNNYVCNSLNPNIFSDLKRGGAKIQQTNTGTEPHPT